MKHFSNSIPMVVFMLCAIFASAEEDIRSDIAEIAPGTHSPPKISDGSLDPFLWSECRPLAFYLAPFDPKSTTKTVAKSLRKLHTKVEAMIKTRLKAARLFADGDRSKSSEDLYITTRVWGGYFLILLEYRRLLDTGYGTKRHVTIWSSENGGFELSDGTRISNVISDELDSFVQKYQKVNEAACSI